MISKGYVFWLFGLSGSGKSTLGDHLTNMLRGRGVPVLRLDGDTLRGGLNSGLGFSDVDRTENLRRAAEVANLGVTSQLLVVASFITPSERHRQLVRQIVGPENISAIYLSAIAEVCHDRDAKGLYAKASRGEISPMTGFGSPFESPQSPDLVLNTGEEPLAVSAARLTAFAAARLDFSPGETKPPS